MSYLDVDLDKALVWSVIVNGVISVPIMAALCVHCQHGLCCALNKFGYAISFLQKIGLPVDGLRSKSWHEFVGPDAPLIDYVLTVCDDVPEQALRPVFGLAVGGDSTVCQLQRKWRVGPEELRCQ